MVTAGVFLIIRSAPLLEFAPVAKSAIVILGAITALFAASIGLVQSDIKRVIAYSTCSQLGYMVLASGLSNYSASLFHLMNHAFFVRWYRYFDLHDVLSFRNTLIGDKLTYLFSEFEDKEHLLRKSVFSSFIIILEFLVKIIIGIRDRYGEWKRTFVKNCVIVIRLYNLNANFLQEKRKDNTHIISYRSIESTFNLSFIINIFYNKIVKILKISKPVIILDLLQLILNYIQANFYCYAQSGCRIDYQAKALSNVKDRLFLTRSWDRSISHGCYKTFQRYYSYYPKKKILHESISYFHINLEKEIIFYKLNYIIPHWIMLLGNSNKNIHWLRNIIYKRLKTWAIKKFKGNHTKIFDEHLSNFKEIFNFNTLPLNIPPLKNYPVFNDIKKNQLEIEKFLNDLDVKSGIYIFYLTDKPLHFYIGQSIDLKKRFLAHINQPFNELSKLKHPKFYSYVNKYQWDKFSFMIIETCLPEFLDLRENNLLDIVFNSTILKNNTLNLLTSSDWKGYKHTEESKLKLSNKHKGKKLSAKHIENLRLGHLGEKHFNFGKSLSNEWKKNISESLKGHSYNKGIPSKLAKKIIVYDLDNKLIKKFYSKLEAIKFLHVGYYTLQGMLDNQILYEDVNLRFNSKCVNKYKIMYENI